MLPGLSLNPRLKCVQLVVPPLSGHESVVAAPLHNLSILHHQDQIGSLDGGKAVGDDNGGPPL